MKVATRVSCMVLALALALTAARSVKANDDVPQGRVAVSYQVQVDWLYPPTGQTSHSGYIITVYYDNGQVVQVQDNGARADAASLEGAGWQATSIDGPYVIGTTPW